MLIGLTGGIASGKSAVSRRLAEHGAFIIDADVVSREIVEPGKPGALAVRRAFGDAYFGSDGQLDRAALGALIFADEAQRSKLDALLHPLLIDEVRDRIRAALIANPGRPVVLDAALLAEAGLHSEMDEVWVVTAPLERRIERLMQRNGLTYKQALARIRSQMDDAERLAYANCVIRNDGDLDRLHAQVDACFNRPRPT